MAAATPGDMPPKKAPYRMKMPSTVTARWCGMSPMAAKCCVGSDSDVYPPMCPITLTTSSDRPNETMPAAASENSNHRAEAGLRCRSRAQ